MPDGAATPKTLTRKENTIMIIKTNDSIKGNVTMTICIDDKAEEITIHIQHHNKQTGVVNGYDYPAAEYSTALADYKKIVRRKL